MKYLLILAIFCISFTAEAQINLSVETASFCTWDDYAKEYNDCNTVQEYSLFKINEANTLITHISQGATTVYYVNEVDSSEEGKWLFDATNRLGTSYYFVFDANNSEIRIIKKGGSSGMGVYYVENTW